MRNSHLVLFLLFFATPFLCAEGTRELAPNANIDIMGNMTTDIAGLYLNNPRFGNFAAYGNVDPKTRFHINIQDPAKECVFLGFSGGEYNGGGPMDFEYRIMDPNGNIVYGPILVSNMAADINGWADGSVGPQILYGPTGYAQQTITSADLQSAGWAGPGDYYIEFIDPNLASDFIINFWDVTVADCSGAMPQEKKGRVWSNNWALFAINDFGFPNRPFNGSFFVCAPDPSNPNASFVTEVDFDQSGFRPGGFSVAFNSFGTRNTGNITADRKSVELLNLAEPEYAIFLNDPIDICETGEAGEIDFLGVSRCTIDEYCIKYRTTKEGQIEILLDFDGPDGVFTPGTADVQIITNVQANEVNTDICLDWDGKDGLGQPVVEDATTMLPIVISYAQGIYHFPIYDAELLTNGLSIRAVRPAGVAPVLYYDDSDISEASGTTEPKIQLSGCALPCHKWTNYVEANTPGYGNLHTINSWWFSQRVRTEVLVPLPGFYTCNAGGPEELCPGENGQVWAESTLEPEGATEHTIVDRTWTGPNIVGSAQGDTINIDGPGAYEYCVTWVTEETMDTCSTCCMYEVEGGMITTLSIDTLILKGDTVTILGDEYSEPGRYTQRRMAQEGCDTLVTITVIVKQSVLHVDFDDCLSVPADSTNRDYSEFTVDYPDPLSCAEIETDFLFRENPDTNHHSCTPGVNGTPAMCVSSLDTCAYIAGHQRSVVVEVMVTPLPDTAVLVTGLEFYEKAPEMYDWINGPSGPNNYPTVYGLRVLKNGMEIYREFDIPTTRDWSMESFDFSDNVDFITEQPALYRFELLGYCLVGDTSKVAAWDLDELSVTASCVSPVSGKPIAGGRINSRHGFDIPFADVFFSTHEDFAFQNWNQSDDQGLYSQTISNPFVPNLIRASKNDDWMNGISTKDLILIKQHLLGRVPLSDPMDMVAADVNNSQGISSADIAALRKLILGKVDHIEDNTSWRMIDAQFEIDHLFPFDLEESITVRPELMEHHFTGIKIGDVSGDANYDEALVRGLPLLPISLVYKEDRIEVFSTTEADLRGLQMRLAPSQGHIEDLFGRALAVGQSSLHFTQGGVNLCWFGEKPIASGQWLFTLYVDPGTTGLLIDEDRLQALAFVGEDLEDHKVEIRTTQEKEESITELLVSPNPTSSTSLISFELKAADNVELVVYDALGKTLYNEHRSLDKGIHDWTIDFDDLQASGVVLIQLKTDQYSVQEQIIVMGQ